MNISIREIEYVLTVAKEGNLSRAAQMLNVSQSALSQAILKIEATVGTSLFIRKKNGFAPTEIGAIFIKYGREIMRCTMLLETALQPEKVSTVETLRIGIPFYLGSRLLPGVLQQFREMYPNIELVPTEMSSRNLETELLQHRIDTAVIPLPIQSSGIAYEEVLSSCFSVFLSYDDPFMKAVYTKADSNRRYIDLSALEHAPFVMLNQGHRTTTVALTMLRNVMINPQIAFSTANFDTLKRMVANGLGVALVPDMYVSTAEEELLGLCRVYLEDSQNYPWTIAVAYDELSFLTPASQCFINYIKQCDFREIR